jgi:hypothetical protein
MAEPERHKWIFTARFRRNAFGWKSQPAIKRVREAVSEIQKSARKDPLLAAEGAVLLLEKLSPVLEQVDSSSGAIGTGPSTTPLASWCRSSRPHPPARERTADRFAARILGKELGLE